MSKYQGLTDFLNDIKEDKVCLSFASIDDMIEGDLPDSAYLHRPWWANRTEGRGAQNLAWQSVGWETRNVSMELDEVEFIRVKPPEISRAPKTGNQKLSIAEAKSGLAANFGVSEDAIEIHIRG